MPSVVSALIFVPIVAAIPVYVIGRRSGLYANRLSLAVSILILALSLYSYAEILRRSSGAVFNFVEGPIPWITALKGVDYYVGIDGLSAPLVVIAAFLTVLVIIGSGRLITERQGLYYALVVFFEGSIIGVFTSLNLIVFYVFFELVLIPMFFFIGIWGGPNRKYAALKFLLFTFAGSTIMLLGFFALYVFISPATFNITELAGRIPLWLQILASIATFIGFGVKLPVVPFHTWLPDAHVEAPAPISVFLAGLLLKMGGYGFLRINLGLFPEASREYAWVFILFGLITMFYGAIVAMMQKDLKRMIALTSINHMGFVLVGGFSGNQFGISGAVFQMFNHGLAIGLLFMLSGFIHEQAGTRDIPSLKGLRVTMPRTANLLIMGSMAGMGVPIFSNFISELMVIVGAIAVDVRYAVAILIPIITVAYFLLVIRRSILSPPISGVSHHDMATSTSAAMWAYLVPLFILLLFPSLILDVVNPASALFVQAFTGV